MTGQGPQAPGVIQVRLTGHQDDTATAASVLAVAPGLEILTGPDGPYRPGARPASGLYLTVRLTPPPTTDAESVTPEMEGHPDDHRP